MSHDQLTCSTPSELSSGNTEFLKQSHNLQIIYTLFTNYSEEVTIYLEDILEGHGEQLHTLEWLQVS